MRRLVTIVACLTLMYPATAATAAAPQPAPTPVATYELPDGMTAMQAACDNSMVIRPGWNISPANGTASTMGPLTTPLGRGSRWISADSHSVPGLGIALDSMLEFADVSVSAFQASEVTLALDVMTPTHGRLQLRQDLDNGTGSPWIEHHSTDQWFWQGTSGTLDEFAAEYGDGPATGYVWAGDCNGGRGSFPNPTSVDALTYGAGEARTTVDFEPAPTSVVAAAGPISQDGSRTLSCRLLDRTGRPIPDQEMGLTALPWTGNPEPERVGSATTGADGVVSFRVRPRTPTRYRCEFRGGSLAPSTSAWTAARVRPKVTVHVGGRNTVLKVTGTAAPGRRGTAVVLHLRHGKHTRSVASGRLRPGGRYAFRAQVSPGRSQVWVTVASAPTTTAVRSATVAVRRPR